MKNIYVMIIVTISFFVVSTDFLFETSIFIDLLLVVIYLILVARSSLKLDTRVTKVEKEHILNEKKTAYFAPLIFLMFLGISISVGWIMVIINIFVVFLLYGYVYVSITRNKIVVSNESITANYLNGKTKKMHWKDISKVDFNWVYNLIVFKDVENNEIKLDISLEDFLLVIIMIKQNLLKEDYQEAFRKLRVYNNIFLMNSNNVHLK